MCVRFFLVDSQGDAHVSWVRPGSPRVLFTGHSNASSPQYWSGESWVQIISLTLANNEHYLLSDSFFFIWRMHCSSWETSLQVLLLKLSFSHHLFTKVRLPQNCIIIMNPTFISCIFNVLSVLAVCVTTKKVAAPEISCSFSKHAGGSQDPAPIISVPAQRRLSQNSFSTSGREDANDSEASASPFTDQPIFFRLEVIFIDH